MDQDLFSLKHSKKTFLCVPKKERRRFYLFPSPQPPAGGNRVQPPVTSLLQLRILSNPMIVCSWSIVTCALEPLPSHIGVKLSHTFYSENSR